jgi:hypothetical protein
MNRITIEGVLGKKRDDNMEEIYFRNYEEGEDKKFIVVPANSFEPGNSKVYKGKAGRLTEFNILEDAEILVQTIGGLESMSMIDFADSYGNYKPGTVSPTSVFNGGNGRLQG